MKTNNETKKPSVRIGNAFFHYEFVESVKEELYRLALMSQAGMVDKPTACQQLAYELLKEAGQLD